MSGAFAGLDGCPEDLACAAWCDQLKVLDQQQVAGHTAVVQVDELSLVLILEHGPERGCVFALNLSCIGAVYGGPFDGGALRNRQAPA